MDFKEVCTIGLKIVAGLTAGVVVVMGIDKLTSEKETSVEDNFELDPGAAMPMAQSQGESGFSSKLRTAQNYCEKTTAIVQTLGLVVDNMSRVFGKNQQPQDPYYRGYYGNYGAPMDMGQGGVLNRVAPNIIVVDPPMNNSYRRGY